MQEYSNQKNNATQVYLMRLFILSITILFFTTTELTGQSHLTLPDPLSPIPENTIVQKANGPMGPNSSSSTVQDDEYGNPLLGSDFVYEQLYNRLELKIDRDQLNSTTLLPQKIEINLNVTYEEQGNPAQFNYPGGVTLTIDFDPANQKEELDIQVFKIPNAIKSQISINTIKKNGTNITNLSITEPPVLLTNEIKSKRIYNFIPSISSLVTFNTPSGTIDYCNPELERSWLSIPGAIAYDVEWMFVDEGIFNPGNYEYNFRTNSSRIRVTQNNFSIPIIYPKGFVIFRVRPIGKDFITHELLLGTWTIQDKGIIDILSLTPDKLHHINNGYETDLNWQYTLKFAEENKRKGVITYFDGTLRKRQVVTQLNSQNTAIVGQSVYDFLGRPAVNVLPVPDLNNNTLCFRKNFNISRKTGEQYDWEDFDLDSNLCTDVSISEMAWSQVTINNAPNPPTIVTPTSGAAYYFSPNNPNSGIGKNSYIADAEGYPFNVIEYTSDNTGRVKRRSGIGKNHRLRGIDDNGQVYNNTKETQFFYSTPSQEKLYYLFGNEIGDASHYKKNMTIDANGQANVQYLDPQGRVVASAIAGVNQDAPNLTLISNPGIPNKTIPRTFPNNNTNPESDRELKASYAVTIALDGVYEFSYSATPEIFGPECMPENICFGCIYDLKIDVLNDCEESVIPGGPIFKKVGTITEADMFYNGCTELPFNLTPDPLSVQLTRGAYKVVKTLTVNKEAYEYYKEQFFNDNNCVKTLEDFVAEEENKINTRSCNYNCEDCEQDIQDLILEKSLISPTDPLKTEKELKIDTMILEQQKWCDDLCKVPSQCDIVYEMLLGDVSPSSENSMAAEDGQYFQSEIVSKALWNNSSRTYYNADGTTESKILIVNNLPTVSPSNWIDNNGNTWVNGDKYVYPQFLNLNDFKFYWKTSWANELVQFHPEYPCWQKCGDLETSYEYDLELLQTTSAQIAINKGYFDPLNMRNDAAFNTEVIRVDDTGIKMNPSTISIPTIISHEIDPIESDADFSTFLSDLEDKLYKYEVNPAYNGIDPNKPQFLSIWTIWRRYMDKYTDGSNDEEECFNDIGWPLFRSLYLAAKQDVLKNYYNGCGTYADGGGKQRRFFYDISQAYSNSFGKDGSGNNKSWIDQPTMTTDVGAKMATQCQQTCENYAEKWIQDLSQCNIIAQWIATNDQTSLNNLKADLIKVCTGGCDLNNPFGSVNLSPLNELDNTNYPYNNFKEVIENHIGISSSNWFTEGVCDDLLITWPNKYGHDYLAYANPENNECACEKEKFSWQYRMYMQQVCPGWEVIGEEYNDCACDLEDEEAKKLLLMTRDIPQDNRCKNCKECEEIQAVAYTFMQVYEIPDDSETLPGETADDKDDRLEDEWSEFETLITRFLNRELGFNLQYNDYYAFLIDCFEGIDHPTNTSADNLWERINYKLYRDHNLDLHGIGAIESENNNNQRISPVLPQLNDENLRIAQHNQKKYQWEIPNVNYDVKLQAPFLSKEWDYLASLKNTTSTALLANNNTALPYPPPGTVTDVICNCNKILTADYMKDKYQSVLPPINPIDGKDAYELINGVTAPSNFGTLKDQCCKLFKGLPPNDPAPCDPSDFKPGSTWSDNAKMAVTMALGGSQGLDGALSDNPCSDRPSASSKPLDECGCKKLIQLQNSYNSSNPSMSFKDYASSQYSGLDLSSFDLDKLLEKCKEYYASDAGEDANGNTPVWNGSSPLGTFGKKHLKKDVNSHKYTLPREFSCCTEPNPPSHCFPVIDKEPDPSCPIHCYMIKDWIRAFINDQNNPVSLPNTTHKKYVDFEQVWLIFDQDYGQGDPVVDEFFDGNGAGNAGLKSFIQGKLDAYFNSTGCPPKTYSMAQMLSLLGPCLPNCPGYSCETFTDLMNDYISANTALYDNVENNIGNIARCQGAMGNAEKAYHMMWDFLHNKFDPKYYDVNNTPSGRSQLWIDMNNMMNGLTAHLNTELSNPPFCTRNFTAKQWEMQMMFMFELGQCKTPCPPDPVADPPCEVCYSYDGEFLTDFVDFLNQMVKPEADILDKHNRLLINNNSSPVRDIDEYHDINKSILYPEQNCSTALRYLLGDYPLPANLQGNVKDNCQHDLKFELYFPSDADHFHWGEILAFRNIEVKKPADKCVIPDRFFVEADVWVPKHVATQLIKQGILVPPEGLDPLGQDDPGYIYTINMAGNFPNNDVITPLACPKTCLALCNKPYIPTITIEDECEKYEERIAFSNAEIRYREYIKQKEIDFENDYYEKCLSVEEEFTGRFPDYEYQYTLYHYDQAGNMIKSVPPEGVEAVKLDQIQTDARINAAKDYASGVSSIRVVPNNEFMTNYIFNDLNQLVQQETPDGGIKRYWYDNLGKLIVAQNPVQVSQNLYNYTLYDALGRVYHVGQIEQTTSMSTSISCNPASYENWITNVSNNKRTEISTTYYTEETVNTNSIFGPDGQENLRNRISSVTYEDVYDGDDNTFNSGTHYSYDFHGNVKIFVQDFPNLRVSQRYKKIEYSYELISGNIREVAYQSEQLDAFYHRYSYDEDNKLTEVKTSKDYEIWESDARYDYFLHEALARVELGELQVQGIDYAYTIHGWLKGINSETMEAARDIGKDGSPYNPPNVNREKVARDAFGIGLHYFQGDYNPIDVNLMANPQSNFLVEQNGSDLMNHRKDQYNGNLSAMITTLPNAALYQSSNVINASPQAAVYSYDKISRLREMKVFDNVDLLSNTWLNGSTGTDKYYSSYDYDGNGNLTYLKRHGNNMSNLLMDELTYHFQNAPNFTGGTSNKLTHVTESNPGNNSWYNNDVDHQGVGNYTYDEIGNLIQDLQEEIQNIEWNSAGKISKVTRTATSTKDDLEFLYNSSGQRIGKIVKPKYSPGQTVERDWLTTWYVWGASGNLMSTYSTTYEEISPTNIKEYFVQNEVQIYGSSRVGALTLVDTLYHIEINISGYSGSSGEIVNKNYSEPTLFTPSPTQNLYSLFRGNKNYELVNHTENVIAVITDRKIAKNNGGTSIDHYEVDYVSFTDYYPYGMEMEGRTFSSSNYRFGYAGQEKDNEVSGNGNVYNFGARMYDARLGRWFSSDPKEYAMPSHSPYVYALGNPIIIVDVAGQYPKPSSILADLGWKVNPLIGGLMDGFVSGLGWFDAAEFAYDLATDSKFRSQLYQTFKTIASDPIGFAKYIAKSYMSKLKEIGSGSDKGKYLLGEMIGELAGGVVAGGAAVKLLKLAKGFKAAKLAKKTNPCGCFTQGTLILTDAGLEEIQNIKIGDLVYAYDSLTNNNELKQVTAVFKLEREAYYTLYIGNEAIEVSSDHPFYINNHWVKVHDLKIDDLVQNRNGEKVKLDSIIYITKPVTVYNFTVKDYHNYYVTNTQLLVHNTGCKLGPKHHIATNKNSKSTARGGPWTPKFDKFFKGAKLDINKSRHNIVAIPGHKGPHPEAYHKHVFNYLSNATKGKTPGTAAYREAVIGALNKVRKQATTKGSYVNKLLTKTN